MKLFVALSTLLAAAAPLEHTALRPDALHPVNNDVQAARIDASYLDDVKVVAAAKAAFQAPFDVPQARPSWSYAPTWCPRPSAPARRTSGSSAPPSTGSSPTSCAR